MSGGAATDGLTAYRMFTARAYKLERPGLAGKTVAGVEALFAGARVFIERVRRGGTIVDVEPSTRLEAGVIVALAGRHEVLVESGEKTVGKEVEDRELLTLPVEVLEVVLTKKSIAGKTLGELAASDAGRELARGVFLQKVVRAGHEMPLNTGLKLDRGDHLVLIGAKRDVERIADRIGYPDRPTDQTDMVFVGAGIVLGGLVGAASIEVGGIPLSLSTSGGALIAGLVFGWLRSTHPTFGRIPAPALWMMNSVGMTMFIAAVGITSGPGFVAGFQQFGLALVIAGVVATTLPMVIGILLGKWIFKFHPAINLGVNAGARVSTASLGQITEAAKSQVPALGYSIPFAISNTLLIIWGIVIVLLIH